MTLAPTIASEPRMGWVALPMICALGLAASGCEAPSGEAPASLIEDGAACAQWQECRSGLCLRGLCGLPAARFVSDGACGTPGESCVEHSDCCEGAACALRVCTEGATRQPMAPKLDCPTVEIGARCLTASDCGPGAVCLRNLEHLQFPGGYCSINTLDHAGCCPRGTSSLHLAGFDIKPCIQTCITHADCRAEDGFVCALGGCFPPPHEELFCEDPATAGHCHQDLDGPEGDDLDCRDNYDNDADGLIDCEDEDCGPSAPCTGLRVSDPCLGSGAQHLHGCGEIAGEGGLDLPETCTDGVDTDGDGDSDCQDDECAFAENCRGHGTHHGGSGGGQAEDERAGEGGQPSSCDDGEDNDDDGDVDCLDVECASAPHCGDDTDPFIFGEGPDTRPVTCIDGLDNDGDGVVDCDDSDCAEFRECVE